MKDDGFAPYDGDRNPLKSTTQGALVRLRSGELAIVAPQDTDDYDLETETVWHQIGDADDVVAYKLIPTPKGESVVRAVINYLHCQEQYGDEAMSRHPVSVHILASAKAKLEEAIEDYKQAWPDWPELRSIRRLRSWEDLYEE